MKKLAVLGCTGSIGTQTLEIVDSHKGEYKVVALSCGSNAEKLIEYANKYDCKLLGIADESKRDILKSSTRGCDIYCGGGALETLAACDCDIVVVAVVGMIGLRAVLSALKNKRVVALANKESLVAGGDIVKKYLARGGEIRPVDSEHSAVWQCLRGEKNFKRLILTASGGPFWAHKGSLENVTPEQAVAHPNWSMGKKISVDSATMMNKALEMIEAHRLFDTDKIDYVIHPQSVVHSMIEFDDGSIKAQAGFADMKQPIQYALTYPEHIERGYKELELPLSLTFFKPDEERFPAPKLAKYAIKTGKNAPVVLNAANEAAVRLFLERKIAFTDIVRTVSNALDSEPTRELPDADSVFETHNRIYNKIYLKE